MSTEMCVQGREGIALDEGALLLLECSTLFVGTFRMRGRSSLYPFSSWATSTLVGRVL